MSTVTAGALLAIVWVATSLVGGAILASLAKRIYAGLSWRRLWIVYSGLMGFMVAAVMAIAWW
ncbi:MAG: hypothetical protein R6U63_04285 [Longimicrobiales bacterium]